MFLETFLKLLEIYEIHKITSKFFINYVNKKCIEKVIGITKFKKFPSEINIQYTGHSFRRTSATLLVGDESELLEIKQ